MELDRVPQATYQASPTTSTEQLSGDSNVEGQISTIAEAHVVETRGWKDTWKDQTEPKGCRHWVCLVCKVDGWTDQNGREMQ